ncbi:MAG: hypothetical protein LC640_04760, partial [Frankia sp.]|nr:hypothetical protein [Frankia sp.]
MPETTPPARGLHSLWRVRSYVRPYTGQMVAMLVMAGVGVGAGIVVPLVTKAVIDGPIRHGERHALLPLGLLALLFGVVEAALAFGRRW